MFWTLEIPFKTGFTVYKISGLQLTVCAYYFWEMALHVGLDASFDKVQNGNALRQRADKVNSRKLV
jgi:hypothetical protein